MAKNKGIIDYEKQKGLKMANMDENTIIIYYIKEEDK